jgi:hypothetical protein
MADLVVIVGVVAFFALSALYVAGLDRLVGPDDDAATPGTEAVVAEEAR